MIHLRDLNLYLMKLCSFEILSYILVWHAFYFALNLFVGYDGVYWDGKYTGDVTSHVQDFAIFNGLSQNLHLLFLPHLFLPLPLPLFLLSSIATCYMSNKNKSWVFFFIYFWKPNHYLYSHWDLIFEDYFYKVTFTGDILCNRDFSITVVESRILGLKGGIARESVYA